MKKSSTALIVSLFACIYFCHLTAGQSISWRTPACTLADQPILSTSDSLLCLGDHATIQIGPSDSLNDELTWSIYIDSCSNSPLASDTAGVFIVQPRSTTTYFVRGQGACPMISPCGTITIYVSYPTFHASVIHESGNGAANGQINVYGAQGGFAPYQYSKDNGASYQAGNQFSSLAVGDYPVRIKDSIGCESKSADDLNVYWGTTNSNVRQLRSDSFAASFNELPPFAVEPIEVDEINNLMYWGENIDSFAVFVSNLDGGSPQHLYSFDSKIASLALDVDANLLFISIHEDEIWRGSLDGSDSLTLLVPKRRGDIEDMVFSPRLNVLFFVRESANEVWRVDPDGSNLTLIAEDVFSEELPVCITLDEFNELLYVASFHSEIIRMNTDGSEKNTIVAPDFQTARELEYDDHNSLLYILRPIYGEILTLHADSNAFSLFTDYGDISPNPAGLALGRNGIYSVCGATPDIPVLSISPSTQDCAPDTVAISVDPSSQLNGATYWALYKDACGLHKLDTSLHGEFIVTLPGKTSYFVRGEGSCIDFGDCAMVAIGDSIPPALSCVDTTYFFESPTDISLGNLVPTASIQNNFSLERIRLNFTKFSSNISAHVPYQYLFELDNGVSNVNHIDDGGNDMYDKGNRLNTNFRTRFNYTDGTIVADSSFGNSGQYFTAYQDGLFFLAADMDQVDSFYISGGLGADGEGLVSGLSLTADCGGTTYYGYIKRVDDGNLGADDPTINHLFVVPDYALGSHSFPIDTDDDFDLLSNLTPATRLYYLLFSSLGGSHRISDSEAESIFNKFVETVVCQLTINDNCGDAFVFSDNSYISCSDIGTTKTINIVATDFVGNSLICESTITVVDTIRPTINCPNDTLVQNESGLCGAQVNYDLLQTYVNERWAESVIDFSSEYSPTDYGSIQALGPPNVYPVYGDFLAAWASESEGDQREFLELYYENAMPVETISVYETFNPGAADTLYLRDALTGVWHQVWSDSAQAPSPPNVARIFTITIPRTNYPVDAVRIALNSPAISGWNEIDAIKLAVMDTISSTFLTEDNCGVPMVSQIAGLPSGSFFPVGVTINKFVATDASGNTDTCSIDVTVLDGDDPVAVCQDIVAYLDANGNGSIIAADIDGGSTDNCGVHSLHADITMFDCDDIVLPVNVTLTVFDSSGNADTCVALVTVMDTVSPVAMCQDVTISLGATGMATLTAADVDNGSTDNCAIMTTSIDVTSFDCAMVGSHSVTLLVTDVNGNSSTCISTATVIDTVSPTISCMPISVYLDVNGAAVISAVDVDNGSNDACGIDTMYVNPNQFTCTDLGNASTTLSVVDVHGNVSTCVAAVVVFDTLAPVAICQDITTYLDVNGMYSVLGSEIDGGSTDACGIDSLWTLGGDYTCLEAGLNSLQLVVRDPGGNLDTCVSMVTVVDTVSPTIVCETTTVYLDANGSATIMASDVDGGSFDVCGIDTMYVTLNQFTCTDLGSVTTTLSVVDIHGNVATCAAIVNVLDTIRPIAACKDVTVILDANGNGSINIPMVADFPNFNDNCGPFSVTLSQTTFDCADVGIVPVMLFVEDGSGNADTCIAMVTVIDNTPPLALCQDDTIYLNAEGYAFVIADALNNGSSDICGIDSFYASVDTLFCADLGVQTVTMMALDSNGNQASCMSQVTVLDVIAPTANCVPPFNLYLDAAGQANLIASDLDAGSTDNCAIVNRMISQTSFDCTAIGAVSVDLIVSDAGMNSDTCSIMVTVIDTFAPSVICVDATVYLDTSGVASILPQDVDAGSFDVCSNVTLSVSSSDFDCNSIGTNNVTLYVVDGSGNADSCSAVVTVLDTLAPLLTSCPSDVTLNNTPSNCSQYHIFDRPTASDACGVDTVYVVALTDQGDTIPVQELLATKDFASFPVGITKVTYYAMDGRFNVDSCSFVVTIIDNQAPIIIDCPTDISVNSDPGQCGAIVIWDEPSVSDNCPVVTLAQTSGLSSGSEFPIGATTISYSATDNAGLTSTCMFTITVNDNEAPVIVCEHIDAYLDVNGVVSIDSSSLYGALSDNCGAVTLSISDFNFDCDSAGVRRVTLIASDTSGNSDTCFTMVNLLDTIAPMLVVQDVTISTSSDGLAILDINDAVISAGDNCALDTIYASQDTFTCNDDSVVVDITAIDVNGNVKTMSIGVLVIGTISSNVAYVDLNASGMQTGLNWENAFLNIDEVYNSCLTDIDTIKVAEGIYVPSGNDRTMGYVFYDDIVVVGGYSNAGSIRDTTGAITQLCGNIGVSTVNTDNVYHVVTIDTGATQVIIDGFTINCGYANGSDLLENQGAGLLCLGKGEIRNVIITDNFSIDQCSALLVSGSGDLNVGATLVKSTNNSLIGVIFGNDPGSLLTINPQTTILE